MNMIVRSDPATIHALNVADAVVGGIWRGDFVAMVLACNGSCIDVPTEAEQAECAVLLGLLPLHRRFECLPLNATSVTVRGVTENIFALSQPAVDQVRFDPRGLIWTVDICQRLIIGQWDRLDHFAREAGDWSSIGAAAMRIRCQFAVNDLFRDARVSHSIGSAPDLAKRLYNVWKLLGGGVAGREHLRVDGDFVWEVLES